MGCRWSRLEKLLPVGLVSLRKPLPQSVKNTESEWIAAFVEAMVQCRNFPYAKLKIGPTFARNALGAY